MKKKNIIVNILNISLVVAIFYMLSNVQVEKNTIKQNFIAKNLSTSLFTKVEDNYVSVVNEVKEEEVIEPEEEQVNVEQEEEQITEDVSNLPSEEKVIEETTTLEEVVNTIKTYTGKFSYYYANCTGCSGITSTGVDVSDGKVYYDDKEYGKVRIIAAGPEIPKWSIVRINNSTLGANVLGIVLDRGGDIGEGRKFLIDILTNSQESIRRNNNNVVVEVLREGK